MNNAPDAALAVVTAGPPPAPLPVYSPADMLEALTRYRALQQALDAAMPDALIEIGGQLFRTKAYWRAIATAFSLSVTPLEERRVVHGSFQDGRENFGWLVLYQAVAPRGRAATGDGACFAVEKALRFRCPHRGPRGHEHYPPETCSAFDPNHLWRTLPPQASEHNIRAHAHTRGYTRAISNLVGFAETPAEELAGDEADPRPRSRRRRSRSAVLPAENGGSGPIVSPATIDAAQQRQIFERARDAGLHDDDALRHWFREHGVTDTRGIRVDQYDALLDQLLIDRPGADRSAPRDSQRTEGGTL